MSFGLISKYLVIDIVFWYTNFLSINIGNEGMTSGRQSLFGRSKFYSHFSSRTHSIPFSIPICSKHHQCISYSFPLQYQITITFTSKHIPLHTHSFWYSSANQMPPKIISVEKKITLVHFPFGLGWIKKRRNENYLQSHSIEHVNLQNFWAKL